MREMKDSGVEWIGEVPQNWKQSKVKYLMSLTNGRAYKQQELLAKGTYRVLRVGNFNTNDKWYYSDFELPEKQYCKKGDLLYLWATTFGPVFWNEEKVIYHYHIWKVDQFRDYLQRYAFYALGANAEWQRMQSHGSTMVHVTKEGVENTVFPVPPLSEQRRIVSYLDERCAAIDADIDKRRMVIEKLKEYKKSLITRAVTKGLDPNAEMKDSGVEWIGEVPAGWEIHYPKALFFMRNERMKSGDTQLTASQEYGVIPQSEFQEREGRRVVQVILNPDILKHVEVGDFVMHMRSFQGGLELADQSGCVSSAYVMLHRRTYKVRESYFKYLFKSSAYIDALRSTSNLVRDGQALRFANFIQVHLPLPSIDEQDKIAVYLDERCAAIDEAISRQKQLIEKLGEYRKSIIHHAVTGKIDCTEA